ncbi:hypothetical protein EV715DRAFT_268512 [Schizophyllum commune]
MSLPAVIPVYPLLIASPVIRLYIRILSIKTLQAQVLFLIFLYSSKHVESQWIYLGELRALSLPALDGGGGDDRDDDNDNDNDDDDRDDDDDDNDEEVEHDLRADVGQ